MKLELTKKDFRGFRTHDWEWYISASGFEPMIYDYRSEEGKLESVVICDEMLGIHYTDGKGNSVSHTKSIRSQDEGFKIIEYIKIPTDLVDAKILKKFGFLFHKN